MHVLAITIIVILMLLTTANPSLQNLVSCFFVSFCFLLALLIKCSYWKLDSFCLLCTLGMQTHETPVGSLIAKGNLGLLYISEVRLRDGHTNCFQDAFTSSIFQVQPFQSIVEKIMRADDRSLALPTLAS